jgi:hypothetical protein
MRATLHNDELCLEHSAPRRLVQSSTWDMRVDAGRGPIAYIHVADTGELDTCRARLVGKADSCE